MTRSRIAKILISFLSAGLFLTGCGDEEYWNKMKPMTSQQIIDIEKTCRTAGLGTSTALNSHMQTVYAQCYIPR